MQSADDTVFNVLHIYVHVYSEKFILAVIQCIFCTFVFMAPYNVPRVKSAKFVNPLYFQLDHLWRINENERMQQTCRNAPSIQDSFNTSYVWLNGRFD